MLRKRVQEIVDIYWGGNVKAAAKQLGVPQNTLYRIVSGETPNPRANVLAKIARFSGTSVEYLLTGEGQGPQTFDERGRRLSGGSVRWWRVVKVLYPNRGGVRELLDDLPFAPSGFAQVLHPAQSAEPVARVTQRNVLRSLSRVQDTCAEAWAELLWEAITIHGADTVRKRLDRMEIAVAGGFTAFAVFLANGGMAKAAAQKYLDAWEGSWNPADPPDE